MRLHETIKSLEGAGLILSHHALMQGDHGLDSSPKVIQVHVCAGNFESLRTGSTGLLETSGLHFLKRRPGLEDIHGCSLLKQLNCTKPG